VDIQVRDYSPEERDALRLAAIVDSSDDAIISKDLNGIITSWNRAAERLFGFTPDEAIGKSIRMVIPADRQAEEDEVLGRIRQGLSVEHFETIRQRKDGSQFPISLTVSPIRDGRGRLIGASKIARDITERRLAELHAEQSNRRTVFLAQISEALNRSLDSEKTLKTMASTRAPPILSLIHPPIGRMIVASRTKPATRRPASSLLKLKSSCRTLGSPIERATKPPNVTK